MPAAASTPRTTRPATPSFTTRRSRCGTPGPRSFSSSASCRRADGSDPVRQREAAVRIAVLLLAHESAADVAKRLSSAFYASPDVKVYLHHDPGSPHHDRAAFEAAIAPHVRWQWLPDGVRGRWGEWALVDATLRLMAAALADTGFAPDRLLLASGSCRPIRPLAS